MKTLPELLRTLPSHEPPTDGWQQLERRLQHRRTRRTQRWGGGLAIAASTLVAIGLVFHGHPTTQIEPASPLTALMTESAQLEQRLHQIKPQVAVWNAALAASSTRLEDSVALIDVQLNYASDNEASTLWRDRISLMTSLVRLHESATHGGVATSPQQEWTL